MRYINQHRRLFLILLLTPFMLVLVAYVGVIAYYVHVEPSLVYIPSHRMRTIDPAFKDRLDNVTITSSDGINLSGRILLADGSNGRWIYFLHGNGGNLSTVQPWFSVIHEAKANLFVLDYRGYGESQGSPSERGFYSDAEAGYWYLVKQEGVPPDHIIVYGLSLGASVAIDLSAREPVGGLIVEGALISVPALGQEMYPFLPVRWIASNHFDSSKKIHSVTCPKLFMHALGDRTVPIHHSWDLFGAASEPKEFVELKGDHGEAVDIDREHLVLTIARFAEQIVPVEQRRPADARGSVVGADQPKEKGHRRAKATKAKRVNGADRGAARLVQYCTGRSSNCI